MRPPHGARSVPLPGSGDPESGSGCRITVAICTYNRAELLGVTLESLARMAVPEGLDWELLAVDNNSDDETRAVVSAYDRRLPLRYLLERRQGLSVARNRAVREAQGDYVVWTDDDVKVCPGWIAAYADAIERWPEAAFFGGPLLPWYEGEPPAWLARALDKVEGAFAVKDLGPEPVKLEGPGTYPFGANMAFRADVLRSRRFDVRLGRKGQNLISGEETRLMHDLVEHGLHGRWVPAARVEHLIPSSRQTLSYLRNYYRALGRTSCLLSTSESVAQLFGRPRWAWRALVERQVLYWFSRFTGAPPEKWVHRLRDVAFTQGVLLGYPEAESDPS